MRAIDRAQAIKDMTSSEWNRGKGAKLEKVKGQQKLTVDKEPEFIYDRAGDVVGVDAWVRLFGADGKEVKIDPHRRIVNPPTVPRSGIVETDTGKKDKHGIAIKTREFTPNPSESFYEVVWDSVQETPNAKGWRTKGTVTTIFGETIGGYVKSESFASIETVQQGSGTKTGFPSSSSTVVGQWGTGGGSLPFEVDQSFFSFDTSSLADLDTISAVVMSLYLSSNAISTGNDFTVECREYDWGTSLTSADFVARASLAGLTLVASKTETNADVTPAYRAFTSQAAFLNVANLKTGSVRLMANSIEQRFGQYDLNDAAVRYYGAANAGTGQDPKLTITHESSFIPNLVLPHCRPNRIWRLH